MGSARLAAWQRQRQTYEALMRRSDHLLADVGIDREHVALIAKGIDPRQHDACKGGWRGGWHGLRQHVDAARATRCERHRILPQSRNHLSAGVIRVVSSAACR